MSGIEAAGLALGMISAIISIVDATIKIYEAVKDEAGLPTNFKKSATKLPLISKLLEDAERYVAAADEATETAFTPTLEDCKAQATQLQELFTKVMPEEGESRWDRYVKAARTIGKGGRVEDLLAKAVEEVTKMEPSLPDGFEQMPTYAHYSSGAQNNITGQHINSGGNQMYGSGQQYISTNHIIQYHAPPAIDGANSHGNVYFKVLPVPALEKRSPESTVPISRDKKFVERQDVFRALELLFSQSDCHNRAVLTGLGGVGKSQIAIEYSYRLRERDPDLWVFWVYASTAERFEGAYRSIATTLDLPGADDPKTDVLGLVSRWLSNIDNGRWLMILDNADDINVFQKTKEEGSSKENGPNLPLSSYIPQSRTRSVLVTTRDRRATSWLSTRYASVITVNLMNPDKADQLLCARIPEGLSADSDRAELVNELDYLPLAISQAAAYISARATRISVSKYLVLYRLDEQSQSRLLDQDSGDLRRDLGVPNSVIRTWQISFNQIKRNKPQAAELLSLMAMLDRQGIPEFLLNARKRWWGEAIEVVSKVFPNGSYSNWKTCETLLPHALQVLMYGLESSESILDRASLLYNLSWYNWMQGRYEVAKAESQESLTLRKDILPNHDMRIYESVEMLALVLSYQGKYAEAEAMNRQTLEIREEVLGKTHPDTLTIISNLAQVLSRQGKYADAEAMNRQTLEISEEVLGKTHPDTLTTMSNLAQVLDKQGKYADAEAINRQTLEISEEVLSKTHPGTLTTMSNLASILDKQGKYADAEAINRQTLEIKEEVLGKTHSSTLTTMGNLAGVLSRQGKYADAEAINRQTLEIKEEVLGKTHPSTLTTIGNLASVLSRQGKYADAEAMNRQTLEIKEEVLGKTHPSTLATMGNLALVLDSQGKYADAEAINRQTLEISEEVLGKTHPSTLTTMSNLALVLDSQGKYADAEAMNRQTLEISEEVLGKTHPSTLATMGNLAQVLDRLGKYADAEAMNRQTLEISEEVLGKTHPNTLTSVYCLAYLLQQRQEFEEASLLYQRACTGYQLSLGSEHPTTKACVNHYSSMLSDLQ
ncbi:hypothetical protein BKA61DRAFT_575242 [Leptodontidium sp. MPI-SDFR-AT-0119]|nr:hypothetical protein BKA61DRAFT_575242 [Leptodontidium sp. MPI-SDFR-AT-0119]